MGRGVPYQAGGTASVKRAFWKETCQNLQRSSVCQGARVQKEDETEGVL